MTCDAKTLMLLAILVATPLDGCGAGGSGSCRFNSDCPTSHFCMAGACIAGCTSDAECVASAGAGAVCGTFGLCTGGTDSATTFDAGTTHDAALYDAPMDAGNDAGSDAGNDAGNDPGNDAGNDPGNDAGNDAGNDGGHDAGNDGGHDAGPLTTCTISVSPTSGPSTTTFVAMFASNGSTCTLTADAASLGAVACTGMFSAMAGPLGLGTHTATLHVASGPGGATSCSAPFTITP